jgi:hypothetical protein
VALDRPKGADAPLTLEPKEPFVKPAAQQHDPIELLEIFARDGGFKFRIGAPVNAENGEEVNRFRLVNRMSRHLLLLVEVLRFTL